MFKRGERVAVCASGKRKFVFFLSFFGIFTTYCSPLFLSASPSLHLDHASLSLPPLKPRAKAGKTPPRWPTFCPS